MVFDDDELMLRCLRTMVPEVIAVCFPEYLQAVREASSRLQAVREDVVSQEEPVPLSRIVTQCPSLLEAISIGGGLADGFENQDAGSILDSLLQNPVKLDAWLAVSNAIRLHLALTEELADYTHATISLYEVFV